MKSFIFLVAIATLIIGFSACERMSQIIQPATPQVEDETDEISIGVVLPLTGHVAATGQLMKEGVELALSEINNPQLVGAISESRPSNTRFKFIIEDDTSTPEGAVAAFNKLIHEDGISVILGPSTSSATQAAFPIAQENQTIAITATAGARGIGAIGDFVFRVPLTTSIVIPKGVQITQAKLGYQRAATLYDDTDHFSTDRDETLRETFTANGIELLTTETFQSGDTDFSAQLTAIKALNPDAIFASALPPEKPGILIQGQELGISVPFIISSLTEAEIQIAGDAAEGAITFTGWLPTDDTPGNQAFVQNYKATFGMPPNVFAAASYATVHILAEAINNAESTETIAIRDALANIKDLDTILGKFSFDSNGNGVYEPKALIVKDGILQLFE